MTDPDPVLPGLRMDPLTRRPTVIVGSRQGRPNLPSVGCPFCPGGLEAPEPYDVRWFPNRWPAMPGGRCEMVLYTPDHDAEFWTLGRSGDRKVVDLWAERTAALGSRDDVDYVLVFENRGPEVGATIPHPHGQIYAYPEVPPEPLRELVDGVPRPAAPEDAPLACD
jgi:UDPglucose--hexose-1-phosphate uridylyltransferase